MCRSDPNYSRSRVSTHAPAWGAIYFGLPTGVPGLVSTHAPAWGAMVLIRSIYDGKRFQLTRPHGARSFRPIQAQAPNLFQLTRPHGARSRVVHVGEKLCKFQLTRPHGARYNRCFNSRHRLVSTHAPAWGAISCQN